MITYITGTHYKCLTEALLMSTNNTVQPIIVATSIKQATCIKHAWLQFPKKANLLEFTCIKQAP